MTQILNLSLLSESNCEIFTPCKCFTVLVYVYLKIETTKIRTFTNNTLKTSRQKWAIKIPHRRTVYLSESPQHSHAAASVRGLDAAESGLRVHV